MVGDIDENEIGDEVVDSVKSIEESSIAGGPNNFKNINVAPTILKRGRYKGMTVIDFAKKKAPECHSIH